MTLKIKHVLPLLLLALACSDTERAAREGTVLRPDIDAGQTDLDAGQDAADVGGPDSPVTVDESVLEEGLGGEATVEAEAGRPFATLLSDLPLEHFQAGSRGREFFVADWEPGNTGRELLNGLGPLFHASSCVACHPGTGRAPSWRSDGQMSQGVLLRLRRVDGDGNAIGADTSYGPQLQPLALGGVPAEASVRWSDDGAVDEDSAFSVPLGAGAAYHVYSQNYGPFDPDTRVYARLSPHLTGMGLIDHVSEAEILEWEDPDDLDGDGISGRANWLGGDADRRLGRYGWKANTATLLDQVAFAFAGDMGITSPVVPEEECTEAQTACDNAPNGGRPEVGETALNDVVAYLRLLGVPERRVADPEKEAAGFRFFVQAGCDRCHRTTLHTEAFDPESVLSDQRIHLFSDLLLHDMGAELADGVPDGSASGSEWKTPPLWGIGRVADDPDARFLHDGRANTLDEAILAHGGEAAAARERFEAASESEREALLAFLNSL